MISLTNLYELLASKYPILDPHADTWNLWLKQDKKGLEFFEVAIGTILVQNTNWINVNKAIENLSRMSITSFNKILDLNIEELKLLIQPAGFYNQKANYLRNLSMFIINYNDIPTRKKLLSIKGIGKETADSILTYCYNQPFAIVGAYTRRFFDRLYADSSYLSNKYESIQDQIINEVGEKSYELGHFHSLIVVHSQNLCTKKKPKCQDCFLKKYCQYYLS